MGCHLLQGLSDGLKSGEDIVPHGASQESGDGIKEGNGIFEIKVGISRDTSEARESSN